ncbi:MAG TPA: SDR family NAD(P)-dependent oxidoreductase [Stellaceae bacterium]|nr:SDR family NAD(P)-dependent oxidoreductase [Stellaceae bacterium]
MDLLLNGKTALVTGASEGIGKAITLALAREGVDVAICARRKEPLETAAAEIARVTNRKIVPIPADLTKPEDAENFVKQAHAALGRIDILVNNAGSCRAARSNSSPKNIGRNRCSSNSWAMCAASSTCCPSCRSSGAAGSST